MPFRTSASSTLNRLFCRAAAARAVHVVAERGHAIDRGLQAARVGRGLPRSRAFSGKTLREALGDVGVDLVHQLLDQLRTGGRVEDVVLDRDVLVIKLLEQAEGSNGLAAGTQASLTELLGDSL